jgi:hypothetical protein
LTESETAHICPLTDAALPVSPAPVASVANTERTTGPPVKIGEQLLSASFVGWLFDIVGF